jgi:hypothetical protein
MRLVRLFLIVAVVGLPAGLFSACSDQASTPDLTSAQSATGRQRGRTQD